MTRHRPPARERQVDALFASSLIHDLAADLDDALTAGTGQPRRHPLALHLAWGALARLWHSANRLDAELAQPGAWARLVAAYNQGAAEHGGAFATERARPITADTYRHVRDRLTQPGTLEFLLERFTARSVALARNIGLLVPTSNRLRNTPQATRTIYGDGTIVRPMYANTTDPQRRRDPDVAEHVRHDGAYWGNNLVHLAVRGPEPHRRVILALGRVERPGREADTALELLDRVMAYAGNGAQALVYDGALRGVHHDTIMRRHGLIVINKVHPATRDDDTRTWRTIPLGTRTHRVGPINCTHTLVAHNGAVHDATTRDDGTLVHSEPCARQQIRRYRRRDGSWRFALAVEVPCPAGNFSVWISPHAEPHDRSARRPDQLRIIPEHDPRFATLYGLRNDSESINAAFKRTLIANRAPTLGWRRQLLAFLSWVLLNNTLAEHHHAHGARAA